MLSLEHATELLLSSVQTLPEETLPVDESIRRILSRPAVATIPLPPFDNSAMDGYALRAADTESATSSNPCTLTVVGETPAGQTFPSPLQPGQCVRVFTGSALPPGADTVVMQEDTQREEAAGQISIRIHERIPPWDNLRFAGEEIQKASEIAPAGLRLNAATLGLLSAAGLQSVQVVKQPTVALLSSGTELRSPGTDLPPGCIYESNRIMLTPLIQAAGGKIVRSDLRADDPETIAQFFLTAMGDADVIVTSGGVSVGTYDLLQPAFESVGGKVHFWKVAMKPGKPFVHGTFGGKHWFGLPGNPVSAFVTFLLLVRPALLRMQGATEISLPVSWGRASTAISNRGDRRHFLRVRLQPDGTFTPAAAQRSSNLASLADSNALLDLPPNTVLPAGELTKLTLLSL